MTVTSGAVLKVLTLGFVILLVGSGSAQNSAVQTRDTAVLRIASLQG
jgi:hypothetical protein